MGSDTRSDGELLKAYIESRDEAAFTALYGRYIGFVYSICFRYLKVTQEAEDAAAACFLILHRKAEVVEGDKLMSWLHSCAIRTSGNAYVSRKRRVQREHTAYEMDLMDRSTPGEEPDDLIPQIECGLSRLPPEQREALLLHFYQGFTRAEIAQRVGCAEGTVASRIAGAIKKLRMQFAGVVDEGTIVARLSGAALILPVPYGLTLKVAAIAKGEAVGGAVMDIVNATRRSVFLSKVKVATVIAGALLVTGGAIGFGAVRLLSADRSGNAPSAPAVPADGKVQAPAAGVTRYVDGPVIFEDDFTQGLLNWQIVQYSGEDPETGIVFADPEGLYVRPAKEMRAGRQVDGLLMDKKGLRAPALGLRLRKPVEAEAYSIEWSVMGWAEPPSSFTPGMESVKGFRMLNIQKAALAAQTTGSALWIEYRTEVTPPERDATGGAKMYRVTRKQDGKTTFVCDVDFDKTAVIFTLNKGKVFVDKVVVRRLDRVGVPQ